MINTKKKHWIARLAKRGVFLTAGAILAGTGLEIFLVPNNIIDGGIIGISILLSHLTTIPLGLLIFILNMPFLILGYKQIGKTFVLSTLYAVSVLAVTVSILKPVPGLTQDSLLACVFGGIVLGVGVGMIIRYGGSLDGTEVVAIIATKKWPFSVGEVVMFFNIFILSSAALVFGLDKAMYSLIAYFLAYKVIDLTIEGMNESKAVMIISEYPEAIAEALTARLGRGVTSWEGKGAYSGEMKRILYAVVTRLELAKLKAIVNEWDENAFVTVNDVYEVVGGRFKKSAIH